MRMHRKGVKNATSGSSLLISTLRNLCVLCASAVYMFLPVLFTAEAQRVTLD